eukprot:3860086-Pyramimonas_sp.AAC.1
MPATRRRVPAYSLAQTASVNGGPQDVEDLRRLEPLAPNRSPQLCLGRAPRHGHDSGPLRLAPLKPVAPSRAPGPERASHGRQ